MAQDALPAGRFPHERPVTAPDGSTIHELVASKRASMVHCTLPPGAVSSAVGHATVVEHWYFIEGRGEVWRRLGEQESIVEAAPGVALVIPVGCSFQFRNLGEDELRFAIVTVPPWPGEGEATAVEGPWAASV